MTIRIGITGGIGSGKSVVSRLLEVMGIPVYISDVETKQLMMTDTCIRSELTSLLGKEAYAGGALNKPLLASYLFGSPGHARQINGIIHPRVKEDFRQWLRRRATCSMAGIESAILIEAGFAGEVDVVVMVYAPEEIRVQRAMKRDASSRELIEKRIRSQMSDEEKRGQADFVIVNDGETPLIPIFAHRKNKLLITKTEYTMLKTILSISGKPGLYKLISQGKNMLIVESLVDKKRFPAYGNEKIISLGDIAMYTDADEVPLKDVLLSMKKKENGAAVALDVKKASVKELQAYLAEVLPNFDRDRVYVSDIKKLITWYNLLVASGMTDFEEVAEEAAEKEAAAE